VVTRGRPDPLFGPQVSAVVPALEAQEHLVRSLPPLVSSLAETLIEVIVVDDGSEDGSAEVARSLGCRVLSSGGRARGPAHARNVGAEAARGDILLFVDADVVVGEGVLQSVASTFEDPTLGAVYGSYDAAPAHTGFASRYMNLRHHYGHRLASDDAPTFWSGLGAVRRDAFLAAGGFDAAAYPYPSIEDIDLGRRLRERGVRIRRDPRIQGTHLKRWTWRQVVHTDVVRRAMPWAQLMLRHPGAYTDLNVGCVERLKAVLAAVVFVTVALALAGVVPAWSVLAVLALAVLANGSLALVFLKSGGLVFSVLGMLFHQVYFLYSSATYLWCVLRRQSLRPQEEQRS